MSQGEKPGEKLDRLWAPWRIGYILGPKPDECFLCVGRDSDDDRACLVISRGERVLTMLNRYPYNNGHLLVSPLRHVSRLQELDSDERAELFEATNDAVDLVERRMGAQGVNVGINLGPVAGAGTPEHLHVHVIPRWAGDTNFMCSVAGSRVIPQSLDEAWELLSSDQGWAQ